MIVFGKPKEAICSIMVKRLVLKPIVWNNQNYKQPCGIKKSGHDFVAKYGYGYEEWNNNDNWLCDGQRVFYTHISENFKKLAQDCDLGMLMIASNLGKQYAVGMACGVRENTGNQRKEISKKLRLLENGTKIWQLNDVKECFSNNEEEFKTHWKKNHSAVLWQCKPELYHWFEEPIELDPKSISGKNRLVSPFSRFQQIFPERAWKIIDNYIPADHEIREWLSSKDFDNSKIAKNQKIPKNVSLTGKSNKPTDTDYVRYTKKMEIIITPAHDRLQKLFVSFLENSKAKDIYQDQNYIDVQFSLGDSVYIVEVKPSQKGETQYPIRAAIGQVLEYRFKNNLSAIPLIVIGCKPSMRVELDFVKSLGISICWPTPKPSAGEFDVTMISKWPDGS